MTWDYRVLRHRDGKQEHYQIHEVYYDDEGQPKNCTAGPVTPLGESVEELRCDCAHYLRALELPVLDFESFGSQSEEASTSQC